MVEFKLIGWVILVSLHIDDYVNPDDLNFMSQLCGELYCIICVGHVSDGE